MTFEQVNEVCSKYGIALSDEDQLQLIIEIALLPTSDIINLFNDINIEIAFESKERILF